MLKYILTFFGAFGVFWCIYQSIYYESPAWREAKSFVNLGLSSSAIYETRINDENFYDIAQAFYGNGNFASLISTANEAYSSGSVPNGTVLFLPSLFTCVNYFEQDCYTSNASIYATGLPVLRNNKSFEELYVLPIEFGTPMDLYLPQAPVKSTVNTTALGIIHEVLNSVRGENETLSELVKVINGPLTKAALQEYLKNEENYMTVKIENTLNLGFIASGGDRYGKGITFPLSVGARKLGRSAKKEKGGRGSWDLQFYAQEGTSLYLFIAVQVHPEDSKLDKIAASFVREKLSTKEVANKIKEEKLWRTNQDEKHMTCVGDFCARYGFSKVKSDVAYVTLIEKEEKKKDSEL